MKIAYGVSYLLREHLLVARTVTFFTPMITVSTRTPVGPVTHIRMTPGRGLFLSLIATDGIKGTGIPDPLCRSFCASQRGFFYRA